MGYIIFEGVVFVGKVMDKDLVIFYWNVLCLVFLLFIEGFGFFLLEVMFFGCFVVVFFEGVLFEICGEVVIYVLVKELDVWVDVFVNFKFDKIERVWWCELFCLYVV